MMQDSIDFGTMNIPKLFRMMFIPTLLGMVLSATINIADGIFVGRGVGSDALAAVNIVAPFFHVSNRNRAYVRSRRIYRRLDPPFTPESQGSEY